MQYGILSVEVFKLGLVVGFISGGDVGKCDGNAEAEVGSLVSIFDGVIDGLFDKVLAGSGF